METRFNYTMVGAFVVVLGLALIIIALWLSVGLRHENYKLYGTYMHESVSGLSINSPVKFNGVAVGYVSDIKLSKRHPQSVLLLLKIKAGTPIIKGTKSTLKVQGLTGLAYVSVSGGKLGSKPIKAKAGERYPMIQSKPSFYAHLDDTLEQVSSALQSLLSKENQENLQETLKNLQQVTTVLSKNSVALDKSIGDASVILDNTAKASKEFPQLVNQVQISAKSFQDMSKSITDTSNQVNATMRDVRIGVQAFTDQALPEGVLAMGDLKQLLVSLQHLNRTLEQDPSVLLRGKKPLPPGPGE